MSKLAFTSTCLNPLSWCFSSNPGCPCPAINCIETCSTAGRGNTFRRVVRNIAIRVPTN